MSGSSRPERRAPAPLPAAPQAPSPTAPSAVEPGATVPALLLSSEDALFRDPFAEGAPSDR